MTLEITHQERDGAAVVTPRGQLTLADAGSLRDAVLKRAVEQPRGVLVDLDALAVPRPSLLSVLTVASARMRDWPGMPLSVVAAAASPRMRATLRTIPIYPSVEAALAGLDDPPARLRARRELPAEPVSAYLARQFVSETCAAWPVSLDAEVLDTVVLVANELVENTVAHTAVSRVRVSLEWWNGRLCLAVADDDPRFPVLRDPATTEHGGRGMLLISQTCQSWGCLPTSGDGKVVWATVAVPGAGA